MDVGTSRATATIPVPEWDYFWGSAVEEFVRHRDRTYTFDSEGQAMRSHILVRVRYLVGLGNEANRIEEPGVLGLRVAEDRAKINVDLDPFRGSATEVARGLAVSRRTGFSLREWAAVASPASPSARAISGAAPDSP